jgi:hypothetical protein
MRNRLALIETPAIASADGDRWLQKRKGIAGRRRGFLSEDERKS